MNGKRMTDHYAIMIIQGYINRLQESCSTELDFDIEALKRGITAINCMHDILNLMAKDEPTIIDVWNIVEKMYGEEVI